MGNPDQLDLLVRLDEEDFLVCLVSLDPKDIVDFLV